MTKFRSPMSADSVPGSPGVTVVVPFYNRAAYAARLLASIMGQTYAPSEVLFVDNGSSPDEVEALHEIIDAWRSESIAVRYIACERTGNANFARNLGMQSATTRYVAFLDSDDWWEPEHLSNSISSIESTGKAGVYSGSLIHSNGVYANESVDVATLASPFHLLFSSQGWSAQTSTYVVDMSKVGNFLWDERLKRHQDFDFFLTIAFSTSGWAFNSKPSGHLERNDAGNGRNFDFKSMIRFLHKWRGQFPAECLRPYLRTQLDLCLIADAPDRYYRYYRALYLRASQSSTMSHISSLPMVRQGRSVMIGVTKKLKIYAIIKKMKSKT